MIWAVALIWVGGAALYERDCARRRHPAPFRVMYLIWPIILASRVLGVIFRAILAIGTPR